MELRKQAIGIDISKQTFTACLGSLSQDEQIRLSPVKTFDNSKSGFNRLLRWAKSMVDPAAPLVFLMESTGVYYEKLAHHLHGIGKTVHVVLPNKSSHYAKSLNVKPRPTLSMHGCWPGLGWNVPTAYGSHHRHFLASCAI
jgi:transposase